LSAAAPSLRATDAWSRTVRGAVVGILVMRAVRNPERSDALEAEKRRLEARLRSATRDRNARLERIARAYADYYRAHGKTYHVKAQLESVARKGKSIPSRAALVERHVHGRAREPDSHRGP
jgi:hypothetical protein